MSAQSLAPQLLTGGLENKGVSLKIDWIEGTFKRGSDATYYPDNWAKKAVECRPFNGYTVARKYEDGRIELSNPSRPEMGVHLVMSGGTLTAMETSPEESVKWLDTQNLSFTRLDIAMDVIGYKMNITFAYKLVKDGRVASPARKFPMRGEVNGSLSLYAGTKTSTVYTRVYDKAYEQGIEGDWKRVETVFQGKRAPGAAKSILAGVDYRQLIKGHLDFPDWRKWREIMSVEPVKIAPVYTESKTVEWLMKTAAPSLAREVYFNPGLLHQFLEVVALEIADMENLTSDV